MADKVAILELNMVEGNAELIKVTIEGVEYAIKVDDQTKRPIFVEGTTIKKILLEGDVIEGGGGANIEVDSVMSSISTNPVQNKVIKEYVDRKDDLMKEVAAGSYGQITNYHYITFDSSGKPALKVIDNAGAEITTTFKQFAYQKDIDSLRSTINALQAELNNLKTQLATVAMTGEYDDLNNEPIEMNETDVNNTTNT